MQHPIVAQPADMRRVRHDKVTVGLHWVTAALVVGLWISDQTVDVFPWWAR